MNKTTIIAIMTAGVLLLGTGGAYATGQIARSNSISESDAANFAFVDAGLSPEDATVTKMEFDYEHGTFVYEIEFHANGTEYDYIIDANSGRVLGKEFEENAASANKPAVPVSSSPVHRPNIPTNNDKNKEEQTNDVIVTVEEAKQIALDKAGADAETAVFEKAKLEYENGRQVYDIEFYVRGEMEYDCEIDAVTGAILEESKEAWELEDEFEVQSIENSQAAATNESGQSGTATENSQTSGSNAPAASTPSNQSSSSGASTPSNQSSAPAASTPASKPSTPAASSPASKPTTPAPSTSSNTVTVGDDTYKEEGGTVYEYDEDDNRWEPENDKKIENGTVLEYEDDTNTWEPEDDDRDYDDDYDDDHDDDYDDDDDD